MDKSPAFWQKIIGVYEKSNLSKTEFCKEYNLPISRFYYWCGKLRPNLKSENHVNVSRKSSFLPIKTTSIEKSFCLTLSGGMEVHFDPLPEPTWLAKLIKSLGELHDIP